MTPNDNSPISFRDLVDPGNDIQEIINELKSLREGYVQLGNTVEVSAQRVTGSLKNVSGATSEQQTQIRKAATAAEQLAQKHDVLTRSLTEVDKALLQVNRELKIKQNLDKLEEKIQNTLKGSYDQISATYSKLKLEFNALSQEERENIEIGGKMATQLRLMYEEMDRIQRSTGKYQLGVGHYSRAINGLNQAAAQLVRELPSATVSAQTFFLAISNNIPIFVDQIQRLRQENADLIASGKPGINVLKQTLKSFMSWNTLLVLGITLLTQYGSKIVDWVKELFKGKEAIDIAAKATENYNEAVESGAKSAIDSTSRLKVLYSAAIDEARSTDERTVAVKALQDEYPSYFGNLTQEAILLGDAKTAYDDLTNSLVAQAKARAYLDKITENTKKIIEIETEYADEREKVSVLEERVAQAQERFNEALSDPRQNAQGAAINLANYTKALKSAKEELAEGEAQIEILIEANRRLEKSINIRDLYAPEGETPDSSTTISGTTEKEIQMRELEFIRALQDARVDAYEEGYLKELTISNYFYERKIQDLQKEYADSEDITEDGQKAILELIKFYTEQQGIQASAIRSKWESKRQEEEKKAIDARDKQAQKEWETYRRQQQNTYRLWIQYYDQVYELEMSSIDTSDDLEGVKERKRLEAEKKRWQSILKYNKEQNQQLTNLEIRSIENYIAAIDKELSKKHYDLFEVFGLGDLSGEQKGLLEDGFNTIMDNLSELADSYSRVADAAVEAADEQVSAAQKALDAEIEARNAGYASQVQQAQKELQLAKENQQKALQQQQEAQKAQEALSTISQAVNMADAVAKTLGQFGFWGIPLVAVLLGTFIAAKVKAAQVAKQQTYGEGMVEYLDYGGSHQSGNDIDFGITKDGTRRRVERGEMIGVINKRSVRKFGVSTVSSILDSLNQGTFNDKFGTGITYIGNGEKRTDLSKLEKGVTSLIKQGEKRIYVSDGRIIEISGNRKRITKS